MIIGNVRPSGNRSRQDLQSSLARGTERLQARLHRVAAVCLASALLSLHISCAPASRSHDAASFGYANDGVLLHGVPLPESGPGFFRAKPGEDTRWGAPVLRATLERAALTVARAFPGGASLVVGDLSARHGGQHSRHGSHQTGRDVDILFYLLDASGRSVRGSGFYAFDERGASSIHAAHAPVEGVALFDTPRNWALVRALLLDEQAPAQWIFCADGIKARLLAYGALNEPDPRVLVRAAYVLHQPTSGNPHSDHFHVRIACTGRERATGCLDAGPLWPWLRLEHEKPERAGCDDDASLVRALLQDPAVETP
ncbi:MAG: Murein endopeptidase [Myxococcaceae bacterium]|nr:Murein endopeptidase [Myxococcaceae bacterium]